MPLVPVSAPTTIPKGAIETKVRNAHVRIEGASDESTLTLMLHRVRSVPAMSSTKFATVPSYQRGRVAIAVQ